MPTASRGRPAGPSRIHMQTPEGMEVGQEEGLPAAPKGAIERESQRGGKMPGDRELGTVSSLGLCGLWKSPEPPGTCTREGTNQPFLTKRP